MFLYLCIFFKDFLFHLVFAHSEPVGNLCVKHPNDLGSEQAGILCTVDRNGRNRDAGSASNPSKVEDLTGIPITGRVVCAARTPARWAALPAAAMSTANPFSRALAANWQAIAGVR